MSNVLRYDSLLVHYLAAELDERLRRRRLRGLALDPVRRIAVLEFDDDALSWHLHPTAGWLVSGRAEVTPEMVPLARQTRVARVSAPPDERVIYIDLAAPRQPGRPKRLVVELLGNQWNLLALGVDERIVAALWRRRAGKRELRPGQRYLPPPTSGPRRGISAPITLEEWLGLFSPLPPSDRGRRLIAEVAYMSPLNAPAVLGAAGAPADHARDESLVDDAAALRDAYHRYLALATLPPAEPRVLQLAGGAHPYPLPLPGVEATPYPTLVDAMAAVAGAAAEPVAARPTVSLESLDRLRGRLRQLERRRERMLAELSEATAGAARHRREADLLMANLHLLSKGMTGVELPDWEGGVLEIELDPALGPSENAQRLYERARKESRAAERVPALLRRVEGEIERLRELIERAERGAATPEEVEAALPAAPRPAGGTAAPLLPYRSYRTSGGLEVRVGRNSRSNDELTFRHSSPNDIWLHARDVAGAHVILRWPRTDANPPARDLHEAAVLASLHSRARTSGTVAVDWTRRKYVRKPRKSGPGQVAFERGRTLFVEPDPELERRLRIDAEPGGGGGEDGSRDDVV